MAKPGNASNKKRSEKYKSQGRREKNKVIRQQRAEKRQAKLAARQDYEYKPIPFKEGTNDYNREAELRREKSRSKKTEYQRLRSIFAKLNNEIAKEKRAAKAAKENKGGKRDDTTS